MAGDNAIDIHILSMEHSETKALMEQGGYAFPQQFRTDPYLP